MFGSASKRFGLPKATMEKWRGRDHVLSRVQKWMGRTHQSILRHEQGYHLFLHGLSHSGKTYLCAIICDELRKQGHSISYHRIPAFLEHIFSHYREGGTLAKDSLVPHVLILEDLGRETPNGFPHTKKYLSLLLHERKSGLVITSRKEVNHLQTYYGGLVSDIKMRCIVVKCPVIESTLVEREQKKSDWLGE